MDKSLEEHVVVVTGAGQGIGREIALLAAREGARVVVNDIAAGRKDEQSAAQAVVDEIAAAGGAAIAVDADISDAAAAKRIIEAGIEQWGRIDSVINNAGILRDRMFFNMSDAEWDAIMKVHLYGYFNVSRAAAPHFKEQGSGSFVHFSSGSGLIGNVGQANYAAAKMGVVGLSTGIAFDMKRFGVRSNVVAPWAWSQLLESIPIRSPEHGESMAHQKKHMRPEQIAPLCVFLASPLSKEVTSQIFGVRGNEIYLFNQPRILRSAHCAGGWTVRDIAESALPMLAPSFTPMTKLSELVSWKPV